MKRPRPEVSTTPSEVVRRPGGAGATLRGLMRGARPVTAPLVLNPLMARMAEAAGFAAGYLGGGATGYLKAVLEANLNLTEMCEAAVDIRAVSSLPLILDGACGYGDPMHLHRTIGMSEAAGFAAIEIEDQIVPKRAHHHAGLEHMIPAALMAAKVREAMAARRDPDFVVIARTNAVRASTMDDALRRGETYRRAGADVLLLSMAHRPEQLRLIAERLGGPLMYLTRRGGLAGLGMTLADLGGLGYRIVADPSTPLLAAFAAWRRLYAELGAGFGAGAAAAAAGDGDEAEAQMLDVIGLERLLAVERATVERDPRAASRARGAGAGDGFPVRPTRAAGGPPAARPTGTRRTGRPRAQ